jgi:hypothetical protein
MRTSLLGLICCPACLPAFDDKHQQLMRDILLWVSGEVIILAHNPAQPRQSV